MREDPHQIRRLVIELRLPDAADADEAQGRFSRLCRDRILSTLDHCCSAHCGPDQTLRIDSIEIDLGRIPRDWRDEDVLARIGDELDRRLGELEAPAAPESGHPRAGDRKGSNVEQRAGSDLELFEYFVRNGRLPWWANGDRPRLIHETLVRLIEDAPEALARLLRSVIREDRPLKRLVRQVEDEIRPALLGLLAGWPTDAPAAPPRLLLAVLREADSASSLAPGRDLSAAFWETALATAARSPSADHLPSTFCVEVLRHVAARRRIDLAKLVEALRMTTATADGQLRGTLLAAADALEGLISTAVITEDADEIAASPSEGGVIPSQRPGQRHSVETDGTHHRDRDEASSLVAEGSASLAPRAEPLPQDPSPTHRARRDRADAEDIEVANAGLVLLGPFLRLFFDRLDLLEEGRFRDPAALQRAVGLLGYLAYAEPEPVEFLLPLAKVLCGMDLDEALDFGPPVTEAEAEECSSLLRAVIGHASILGEMSIDGFRGTFLLRKGLLGARDGAWLLRVEQMTFDVVLERFPWSWTWIKLPWMEGPLRVEWP